MDDRAGRGETPHLPGLAGDDAVVIGVDKRYAQLVDDQVSFYDANKDVRYTAAIVEKRFGVAPERVGEWLALVGDDSGNDELPGVKGTGKGRPPS